MEALFGAELSLPMKFFIAFAVVLALIGAAAYLVRRFGAGALGNVTQRGRQPRLAVVDAAAIDNRRRLVIVRRDNVEHLLLVGGPTDVLVEANIVRATPAQSARDFQPARAAPPDISLPMAAADNDVRPPEPRPKRPQAEQPSPWPLQQQFEPQVRIAPVAAAPASPPSPEVAPTPPVAPPLQAEPMIHAMMVDTQPTLVQPRLQETPPPPAVAEVTAPPPAVATIASEDQNLADMAYRLEAALRRPMVGDETIVVPARPVPPGETAARVPPPPEVAPPAINRARPPGEREPPRAPTAVEPRAEPRHERPVYEGLEREMANLLGRPLGSS